MESVLSWLSILVSWISLCTSLTDASMMGVANDCPHLMVLNATRCEGLTDAAIVAIANKCPNLL